MPDLKPRDLQRLAQALAFAQRASSRARERGSEDPALAQLLRDIDQGRRRQLERLRSRDAPPVEAAEPAPAGPTADPGAARVLAREPLTPELLILRLSRPAGFRYAAGQHVKLRVGGVQRTYSLVSAPHEPQLEFFIELTPHGAMSTVLRDLPEGAQVELGQPKGALRLSPRPKHLLLATVTGIAPFVSLLREAFHSGSQPEVHILHGASFQDEFGYAGELAEMSRSHPGLRYTPVVSRPGEPRNAGWQGEQGRLPALLEAYLARHGLRPADTTLYACGQPQMVAAVADRGRALGFEVRQEPY